MTPRIAELAESIGIVLLIKDDTRERCIARKAYKLGIISQLDLTYNPRVAVYYNIKSLYSLIYRENVICSMRLYAFIRINSFNVVYE